MPQLTSTPKSRYKASLFDRFGTGICSVPVKEFTDWEEFGLTLPLPGSSIPWGFQLHQLPVIPFHRKAARGGCPVFKNIGLSCLGGSLPVIAGALSSLHFVPAVELSPKHGIPRV